MFARLESAGFDLVTRNHAGAILSVDFAQQAAELTEALLGLRIPVADLVGSGGGEAQSTQWLRRRLHDAGWTKHSFRFQMFIDGRERTAITHEIDHVRHAASGAIALEIEWNNKDPFFDRDLENFQRLHAQSAISLGCIVTRGESLQAGMVEMIRKCLESHGVEDEAGLHIFNMKDRTARQRDIVGHMMARRAMAFPEAFARQFVADKFGPATTHWAKLEERVRRGVGNPCPLVLIGLPSSVVVT